MKVKVKVLNSEAKVPEFANPGDAGADLFSLEDKVLQPGERYTFNLGIAASFPSEYVAFFKDKSGLAAKHGLHCLAGVVDSSYRGEWKVVILNTSDQEYKIDKGNKIAQVVFLKYFTTSFTEVEELEETSRGAGGFGSTGK